MGLLITPERLASCPVCGCLVLAWPLPGEPRAPVIWDPGPWDRRMMRSLLTRSDCERQGFGLVWGGYHECPPEEDCALKEADRQRSPDRERGPRWN